MQGRLTLLWTIPLCIEQQVLCVKQSLDLPGMELWTIWHREGVVIADLVGLNPVRDFVFMVLFDVAVQLALVPAINGWSTYAC